MKPSAWLALALLLTPCLAQKQNATAAPTDVPTDAPDKQSDYNKIVHHFFEKVKAGNFTDAAHVLVDTNPQDAFNVEKHESLAVPLEKIQDAFGSFKEFKPLVTKTLGDGIGYVYGLAIYERSPIRFEFIFYKDGLDWRMLHVDFNLNYIPEIRDLAGVHIPAPPANAPASAQPTPASKPETPDNSEPSETPSTPPVPLTPNTPAAPSGQPAATPAPPPSSAPAPSTAPQQ
ncbi:MAG: DUF3887 domain-containing protein [Methylacidiphilales bacterium]|nr:DUF3887 domain-containing protein [Candidatus Methylacidiphilales bacterium]